MTTLLWEYVIISDNDNDNDNDKESARHGIIAKPLRANFYDVHPSASVSGTNENTNGLIRITSPKAWTSTSTLLHDRLPTSSGTVELPFQKMA